MVVGVQTHPHRFGGAARSSFSDARPKVADAVQEVVLIVAAAAAGGRNLGPAQRKEAQGFARTCWHLVDLGGEMGAQVDCVGLREHDAK